MSFDKAYTNRKDRRRPYQKSARFDRSCRPGGSCSYCRDNRQHADKRRRTIACEKIEEPKE